MSGIDVRALRAERLPRAPFPAVHQGFRVFLSEKAFDRAVARGDGELAREIGGVLVGQVMCDDGGPYVSVETTIDALHAEEKGTELTFTHATWQHIHEEMDAHHPERRIVGWYHTHPGFGIFLSDRDVFIHRQFFDLSYQIALVYDPKSREHGVFAWHENEPARCRRYYIGSREHVWDGPREKMPVEISSAQESGGDMRENSGHGGEGRDSTTLYLVGLALLTLGGVGGFWYAQRGTRAMFETAEKELQRAQVTAAENLVRDLDDELLALLRRQLGADGLTVPLDEGLALLRRGKERLAAEPEAGLAEIERGLALFERLRAELSGADQSLRRLETLARASGVDARDLSRQLGEQRVALGQLFAELAQDSQRAGDTRRARRLLSSALRIDPGNAELYQKELEGLGQESR